MLFLVDECVNHRVCDVLSRHGVAFLLSTDILGQGAEDPLVARAGDERKAIVLTANPSDFKSLIDRRPNESPRSFRFAGRLSLHCRATKAAERVELVLDLIRAEWLYRQEQSDKRVIIDLYDDHVRISR